MSIISQIEEKLKSLPEKERAEMQSQLLADYARHAAFQRPLGMSGFSRIYKIHSGVEETMLSGDKDVVVITTEVELEELVKARANPLILVKTGASITQERIFALLEHCIYEKAVFIAKPELG